MPSANACKLSERGKSIDTQTLTNLIVGPFGAVIVLAICVVVLARAQVVVPGLMYRAAEERNKILEREAAEQQQLLMAQSEQLSEQKAANARLEERVGYLTEQVQRLTAEIEGLRSQLRSR